MDFGRAVEAVAPELDAVGIGQFNHLIKAARGAWREDLAAFKPDGTGAATVEPANKLGQVVAYMARRKLGRTPIEVGAGRSRRRRGIGHLAGVARRGQHALKRNPQFIGHDLRDLGVQALTHFGAAVVDLDAAVQVHMHQRTGLVKQRGRKGDAEFDRREREAALDDRTVGVPQGDGVTPLSIARGACDFQKQGLQDVVFHLHLVMRGVAAHLVAVQIAQAHIERVQAQMARDVAHDGLDYDHALGPAKAPERGMALGVELAAVRRNLHVFEKIGVVAMKKRAVRHRTRQVGAEAAVRGHHELEAAKPTGRVKAGRVLVGKRVAFARDHEVVVAVEPQLDRALELVRRNCGPHRQMAGLRLLAAKAAAHAPAFHPHRVLVQTERVRHPVLHFAGMLGTGINKPLVLLLRQRVGDLPFQVEVFLAADFERAAERERGPRQGACGVTAFYKNRRQHIALRRERLFDAQNGRQRANVELDCARAAPGLHHRVGYHQAHHLAHVLHRVEREDGFIADERREHAMARNVFRQNHLTHTGQGQRGAGVNAPQPAVSHV